MGLGLSISVAGLLSLAVLDARVHQAQPATRPGGPAMKRLIPVDARAEAHFGWSIAVGDDIAIVGAPFDEGRGIRSGAAYVFSRRSPRNVEWIQIAKLTATDAHENDQFGASVSISHDTAIIGSVGDDERGELAGSAYVFSRSLGGQRAWRDVKKLKASAAGALTRFGESVSIDGDTIVVGAPGAGEGGRSSGTAYVFMRNQGGPGAWGEVSRLTASDGDVRSFGFSVAVSGDTILVGAPGTRDSRLPQGGFDAGAIYVFARNQHGANGWGQVAKTTPRDPQPQDAFGWSVAIEGSVALVGAPGSDRYATDAGAAYIFVRIPGAAGWQEVARVGPHDAGGVGCCLAFGWSVSLSGDTAVIGAPGRDWANASSVSGAAYLFRRRGSAGTVWCGTARVGPSDRDQADAFGQAVAVSGATAVSGAPAHAVGQPMSGAAYAYAADRQITRSGACGPTPQVRVSHFSFQPATACSAASGQPASCVRD